MDGAAAAGVPRYLCQLRVELRYADTCGLLQAAAAGDTQQCRTRRVGALQERMNGADRGDCRDGGKQAQSAKCEDT